MTIIPIVIGALDTVNWCRIGAGTGGFGNKRTCGHHSNYSIVEIRKYTEKCPRDLRRLTVTQTPMRNHRLTPVGKTQKGVTIIY